MLQSLVDRLAILQGGGAALVVRFGLCEVAGLGLHHLAPNVHYEPSTRTACVFSGHLQVRLASHARCGRHHKGSTPRVALA